MCDIGSKAILVAKIRELGSLGLLNLKAGSKAIHVINHLEGLGVKFDFMDALSHDSISNGVFKPDQIVCFQPSKQQPRKQVSSKSNHSKP
jgi:hypothetical protein